MEKLLLIALYLGVLYLAGWVFAIILTMTKSIIEYVKFSKPDFTELKEDFYKPIKLFKKVTKESDLKQIYLERTLFLLGICGIVYIALPYSPLSTETIGSILEKKEYTAYYYVNMFPKENESKNYRVKAEIYSAMFGYGDAKDEREYHISKVFWSNGGYTEFDSLTWDSDNSLIVGKKIRVMDDENKEWYVELTTEKVK